MGIVSTPANVPLPRVTVTALSADGTSIRATVSGSDGVFSFADLPPGSWSLTLESEGFAPLRVAPLSVSAGRATRFDAVLTAPAGAPAPGVASSATAAAAAGLALALQPPEPAPATDTQTPFAIGDLGWMNGTTRVQAPVFDTRFFTPEVRFDVNYLQDFNHPRDHTIGGSSEEFRSGE
ncbi:MAG TPA: carboxypeptidase-like regulatory domain-containing protein, partial [Candidatus Dormibacteraeota bacterium]|nr:carboxypeptidase-like regulatory domain-containing protein [Candidatus Dormibacteraeota bacterium]